MSRQVTTEFAFDIGDVVRLKAWVYTRDLRTYGREGFRGQGPACVYQVIEVLVQICEGGVQRRYGARAVSDAGNTVAAIFSFLESELELAQPLPVEPPREPCKRDESLRPTSDNAPTT